MKKKLLAMLLTAVMAVGLLPLSACSGGGTSAATMHLRRTEGTVSVSDGSGKDVPVLDNLGLYSGYGVGTRSASYAWIDLDDVKLTKLDQNSEITIEKEGKALEIEIRSGSLFFNVTEPLAEDETMNIRTSTMLLGIRGTCGWVEDNGGLSRVHLLEGKVECSAEGQTVQVSAGEMAELTADGELVVGPFTAEDIPAFVRDEVDNGPGETPGSDGSELPESSGGPKGDVIASGEAGENVTWTLYSDDTLVISGTGPMDNYDGLVGFIPPWYTEYSGHIHTVVIENGVTSIGDVAFNACQGLTNVIIPDSVTSIGGGAFSGCLSLTSVTIPDSVTSIEYFAFNSCEGLISVTIPNSVAFIGHNAFTGCDSLTDVYYGGSESQWNQIDNLGFIPTDATIHYAVT